MLLCSCVAGSADIAQDYARRNVNVYGMFQLDMNGYCATRSALWSLSNKPRQGYAVSLFSYEFSPPARVISDSLLVEAENKGSNAMLLLSADFGVPRGGAAERVGDD